MRSLSSENRDMPPRKRTDQASTRPAAARPKTRTSGKMGNPTTGAAISEGTTEEARATSGSSSTTSPPTLATSSSVLEALVYSESESVATKQASGSCYFHGEKVESLRAFGLCGVEVGQDCQVPAIGAPRRSRIRWRRLLLLRLRRRRPVGRLLIAAVIWRGI